KPAHVALDRIDILLLFLRGICVVETEVASAAEFLGNPEVQADRLGVSDMKIAVGFRREPRDNSLGPAGIEVGLYDIADEIPPGFRDLSFVRCHAVPAFMNAHLPERQSRPAYLPNPGARLKRLHVHYGSKTPGVPQPTPQHPFRFLTVTRSPATHLSRVH